MIPKIKSEHASQHQKSLFAGFMGFHYRRCLEYPILIISAVLILCGLALHYAQNFTFDASADTLISKSDPELAFFRKVSKWFGGSSFLVLTYTPENGLLISKENIQQMQALESKLLNVKGVESVTSILDAPLLKSPPMKVSELADGFKTLKNPEGVDLIRAEKELTSSPIFKNLLISEDGHSAMFQINLQQSQALEEIRQQRDDLERNSNLTAEAKADLAQLNQRYLDLKEQEKSSQADLIDQVRRIRDSLPLNVKSYIGGVPMVASDIIAFVRGDMSKLGFAVLGLMVLALWMFFRRLRWVLIPIGTTFVTLLLMIGLLGFLNQSVTAISSNFLPLLAIISISFTIHLIARYRELRLEDFSSSHTDLVYEAMRSKLAPSMYAALTTIVAFSSLLTSDIVPVIDFGWIMCVGILVSLLVTYSFFASILVLLKKGPASVTLKSNPSLTRWFCNLTVSFPGWLLTAAIFSLLLGIYGMSRLNVDNRFLEYFKTGTEIHDGMAFIDKHLGGTIPLDIIIQQTPFEQEPADSDDPFAEDAPDPFPEKYWYTPDKLRLLEKFHHYLDSRVELGKSVSLSSLEQVAREFTDGKPLDTLQLVAILNEVPEEIRKRLINPYASPSTGELRISSRIHETGPSFSREQLINDIQNFAAEELKLPPGTVHVTGMAVLFTRMLSQLFNSQASTLVYVVLATFLMFSVLLKSIKLGIIGLLPNMLSAISILGFMGLVGISLDMMTITIAAIVIGIGVDDAIHYLYRYRQERNSGENTRHAVINSHRSIGSALYFTSVTVIVGFSMLTLSNFVPTIYFGILTALAMVLALLANLTLLPALLLKFSSDKQGVQDV